MGLFAIADEYQAGLRCYACGRSIQNNVCICHRDLHYHTSASEVDQWLEENLPQGEDLTRQEKQLRKTMLSASSQALARGRRRASMGARYNEGETISLDEDERVGFRRQWEDTDVKWHPPSSRWTPKADAEPV